MSLKPLELGPVTRTDVVRYQGASGDMNPVHHDEPFARAAGFPAPLGVGMYPAGALAAWAAAEIGPARVRSVRFRWRAPFFPGDTLRFLEVGRGVEEGLLRLELACENQDGAVLMRCWMTFSGDGAAP